MELGASSLHATPLTYRLRFASSYRMSPLRLRSSFGDHAPYVYRDFPERLPSYAVLTAGALRSRTVGVAVQLSSALFPRACVPPEGVRATSTVSDPSRCHSSVKVGGDGELGARGSLALAVVTGRPRTASASQIGGKRGDCSMGQSMPSGE